MVAWLGKLDADGRLGIQHASDEDASRRDRSTDRLLRLFEPAGADNDSSAASQWVEVDLSRVRVENCRQFGGLWLALEVAK